MTASAGTVTSFLAEWRAGDAAALEKATRIIYDELHRLAFAHLRRERPDHTLQPTALVAEAYLKLCSSTPPEVHDRGHFIGVASHVMRQVLVSHARKRDAEKRGAGEIVITLEDSLLVEAPSSMLLELDDALLELEKVDARKAKIIELVYFGGLEQGEVADLLGVHVNTIARDLRLAKAWIKSQLG